MFDKQRSIRFTKPPASRPSNAISRFELDVPSAKSLAEIRDDPGLLIQYAGQQSRADREARPALAQPPCGSLNKHRRLLATYKRTLLVMDVRRPIARQSNPVKIFSQPVGLIFPQDAVCCDVSLPVYSFACGNLAR